MMKNKSTFLEKIYSEIFRTAYKALFQLTFLVLTSFAFAQTTTTVVLTSGTSGTWPVPCGVTSITVEAWGGGGRGANRTINGTSSGAGGGGGGGYFNSTVVVNSTQSYTYSVGKGGDQIDKNGSRSTFRLSTANNSTSLIANGGSAATDNTTALKDAGKGGIAVRPFGSNAFLANGGNGGPALSAPKGKPKADERSGGGGGAGGPNGAGGSAPQTYQGLAGQSLGGEAGNGAAGVAIDNSGGNGISFGGGGSGAYRLNTGSNKNGGNGADGIIRITYTLPAQNTVTTIADVVICINQSLTYNHTTTGATGIGTPTGLPVGITASWAESKITISGTPTVAGDYTYTIPLIGGCGSAFATGKITVNPAATAGPASSTPIVCINTTTVNITHTTTGATGIGSISGLPTGVNATWEANKITITGKPTVSGTFNYSIGLIGCGTGTATGTITVNANTTVSPATSSPTVCKNTPMTPITHNTTGATGIGSQNGLPPGITATWLAGVITISGTPTTAGTFNYSILLSGGCGFVLAQGTINVGAGVPTTYTNGSWSNGEPDFSKRAIFATNYNTTTINTTIKNIQACTCEVQTGATLTIGAESNAVIQNDIINNGNIIVESDGNLIQKSDSGTYTGYTLNFTVKRNAYRVKRLDYIYWSSPVKDQKMKSFSPGTVNSRFYIYNEIDNTFSSAGNPVTTSFAAAKGYAIRADNGYPNWTTFPIPESAYRDFVGIFKGEPHNGTFTYDLEKEGLGYNLVGNPYPSNVDFYSLVATGAIEGTAYFWTNVVPTPNTQLGSAYDGSNYSTFSVLSGGVPASNSGLSKAPEQYIKVGQGFIVQAKSAGQLNFRNDMRDDGTGSSRFISRGPTAEIDRFWLKLTTPEQNFNTILLAYPQGATNDYESTADAKQFGESADSFYSVLNDLKLNIQGRQFPLSNIDIVPIGMKGNIGGQYNIEMIKKEGIFENGQNVYLKDNQTGIVTNLSEGSYTFAANKGVSEGRFDIVYQSETVLATDATLKEELVVYRDGNDFIVKAQSKKITDIEVFDATGRLVFKKLYNNTNVVVPSDQLSNGMYILKISQGEQTTTKKILR